MPHLFDVVKEKHGLGRGPKKVQCYWCPATPTYGKAGLIIDKGFVGFYCLQCVQAGRVKVPTVKEKGEDE